MRVSLCVYTDRTSVRITPWIPPPNEYVEIPLTVVTCNLPSILAQPTFFGQRLHGLHSILFTGDAGPSLFWYFKNRVGQNHIYTVYTCLHGTLGWEITKYTVMYGVYIYGSDQTYLQILILCATCNQQFVQKHKS
jgi:hypothetical protein